jgi:hypothetical protein
MKAFIKKYSFMMLYVLIAAFFVMIIAFNWRLFPRIWISIKTFGLNIWYYLRTIYSHDAEPPLQVLDILLRESKGSVLSLFPFSFKVFLDKLAASFAVMITWKNVGFVFSTFMTYFVKFLFFVNFIALLVPILILFDYLYFMPNNLAINAVSKPLRAYRRFSFNVLHPIKMYIIHFYHFIIGKWYLKWSLIFLFSLSIGLVQVAFDLVSWYFYFVASFDWYSIYQFLVVAFIDLYAFLTFFPLWVYFLLAYFIFDLIRKNIAFQRLDHFENYDKGFINSTGMVVFIDGTPGSGKTELMTDMVLSNDQIFRDDVFSIMKEIDSLFPHFPFRSLEVDVENNMSKGLFHNRSQVSKYFSDKFAAGEYYGYDLNIFDEWSYVGLELEHISSALIDYAQAYFCYVMSCSFLMSNYSIRTDGIKVEKGHFPLWNYEFFREDFKRYVYSRTSKNIPVDALRFGRQVIENNPDSYVLDNCIISFTEIDKERGNQFDINKHDPKEKKANLQNDKFNISLKLGRHPATLRFRTLFKFYCDSQRVGSVNSDLHELSSTHIHVSKKDEFRLSLPLYLIEPAICEWLLVLLEKIYYRFRFNRSDDTLFINFIRVLKSWIYRYYHLRLNTFGYWPLSLLISDGSLKEEMNQPQKYFLMKKKIHSDRYSTDAYSEFFKEKYVIQNRGFIDLPEFETTKANPNELRYQKSYFVNILDRVKDDDQDDFSNLVEDDIVESVIVEDNLNDAETAIKL